jgi:fatty-acyl-CoA synthase
VPTLAQDIRRNAGRQGSALLFEDRCWTHAEVAAEAAARAAFLADRLGPGPRHIGALLENTPEAVFWLQGAALAGVTLVGLNSTRRGAELARDITHTDCQLVLLDDANAVLVDDDVPVPVVRVGDGVDATDVLAASRGAALADRVVPDDTAAVLIFTSGTTSAPKAAIRRAGSLRAIAEKIVQDRGITEHDVVYAAMPWFHSNAIYISIAPAIVAGATLVLRRRFSASGFLDDVRRYGVTGFNYVGKPLEYILATPVRDDDHDNTLRYGMGNEANEKDIAAFSERFGVEIFDGFGSTEGGLVIYRTPDMPRGSLGRAPDDAVIVLDPATGKECPPARFDADGRFLNADAATGELVNSSGQASFEGYYNNDEATRERLRDGMYWSGDLGYKDADGFLYFAGRGYDWLRVDGENFAAAPVERILLRHPDITEVAVFAVPDPHVGDQVFAALQLREGAAFDPAAFDAFLAGERDLGTKQAPRFVRVMGKMPMSHTNKIQKRALRAEGWDVGDPVWWRSERGAPLRRLTPDDRSSLNAEAAAGGRGAPTGTR